MTSSPEMCRVRRRTQTTEPRARPRVLSARSHAFCDFFVGMNPAPTQAVGTELPRPYTSTPSPRDSKPQDDMPILPSSRSSPAKGTSIMDRCRARYGRRGTSWPHLPRHCRKDLSGHGVDLPAAPAVSVRRPRPRSAAVASIAPALLALRCRIPKGIGWQSPPPPPPPTPPGPRVVAP